MGAFPLANGKGSQLIAEVTRQNKPVVLLTRKFNSRAKAIYSKLFTQLQLNTQKSNEICNKLDYDSQKYDAYLYSKT
jgi:4-diphosphocytidyl-2C-methyl-D-erythritol kinase